MTLEHSLDSTLKQAREQGSKLFETYWQATHKQPDERNGHKLLKSVAASLAHMEGDNAYESVRTGPTGSELGKYALTKESMTQWLRDVRCYPPDAEHIARAVARGKLSPQLAETLSSDHFQSLLKKVESGAAVSPQELKDGLPSHLQERIAGDLVYKFAAYSTDANGNVDIEKVMHAIKLGRMPSHTERVEERSVRGTNNSAQEFLKQCGLEISGLTWSDVSGQKRPMKRTANISPESQSESVKHLLKAAKDSAEARNTVGSCYAGVADALDQIGVHLWGMSAYMAADQLAAHNRFTEVSLKDLRPGDVLVHGASDGHADGHIAVALGDGMESSDHIQGLITGEGYGGTRVFRLRT